MFLLARLLFGRRTTPKPLLGPSLLGPVTVLAPFLQTVPVNVGAMAQALGMTLDAEPFDDPHVIGQLLVKDKATCLCVSSRLSGPNQRFSAALLIAHFVLHRHILDEPLVVWSNHRVVAHTRLGLECDRAALDYACALLAPPKIVALLVRSGRTSPTALAKTLRVPDWLASLSFMQQHSSGF